MRTFLDEARSWFLESLVYSDELHVVLAEGIRSDSSEVLQVGSQVVKDLHALEPSERSRRVAVRFPRTVAWQVVDESYTALDKSEIRDGMEFLVALTQSAYLHYVEAHHGWFKDMVGPATHYRLWTENEVIDAIAHDEPVVQVIKGHLRRCEKISE